MQDSSPKTPCQIIPLVFYERAAYTAMEDGMAKAYGLLAAEPVDLAAAQAAIAALRATAAPLVVQQTYTAFDAAAIILREVLEALLVVAALLAFLRRSNNQDKQRWIWVGAGADSATSTPTPHVHWRGATCLGWRCWLCWLFAVRAPKPPFSSWAWRRQSN